MNDRRPFHVMAKPTGAVCNLDCSYCFFLEKEALYPGSSFRMSDAVQEAYLRTLTQAHGPSDEVVVAFQGGEPTLMGLDFFQRTVELERHVAAPSQRMLNTIQTNATMIDDEWAAFLGKHDFLVGVSIDGPQDVHDAYRVDKGGKPTFERVMRGLEALRRHGVSWNALTSIHQANGDQGRKVYCFLRDDLGATHIQLIPIVERTSTKSRDVTGRSVGSEQYGRFLIEVFEEWARHDVGDVFVPTFDTALAHWLGMHQVGSCVHAETCGRAVALEHNGDVYSCDHFVDPGHLLGSIAQGRTLLELVDSPKQRAFGEAKRDALPTTCQQCSVRFACHGGCPKDRFLDTSQGEPGLNYLCEGYQLFFRHVDQQMQVMAALLRNGRDASGLRTWYAGRDARRSRQDPCTCESGRPFIDCHGSPLVGPA